MLVIGNGLVTANDNLFYQSLKKLHKKWSRKYGKNQKIKVKVRAFEEFSCEMHDDAKSANKKNLDYAVIQEHSLLTTLTTGLTYFESFPYCINLVKKLKKKNRNVKIIFMQTWGHQFGSDENCQMINGETVGYAPMCTYEGMQVSIRLSHLCC